MSGVSVEGMGEKNSRAAANQKRNKHGHRCISCDRAAIELLREKSQIRFMMNCMLAIPALCEERVGAALFQDVFVGLGKWFREALAQ